MAIPEEHSDCYEEVANATFYTFIKLITSYSLIYLDK